jgi:hypothetical protein
MPLFLDVVAREEIESGEMFPGRRSFGARERAEKRSSEDFVVRL